MKNTFWAIAGIALFFPMIVSAGKADAFNANDVSRVKHGNNCFKCDLSGADLVNAALNGLNLSGSNLNNANLSGANMRGTVLIEANLTNSNMSRAKLNGAYLYHANLADAVWKDSDWRGAIMPDGSIFGIPPGYKAPFNPGIESNDNQQLHVPGLDENNINPMDPGYPRHKWGGRP